MSEMPLTTERVLAAAEGVLRRFGPDKATVVDVARALGVSHASVYKHFPTKAALRDAVTGDWLHRVSDPLAAIAADTDAPALPRLRRYLEALIAAKHGLARQDPELFATYIGLAAEAREVVAEHRGTLAAQVTQIVQDGVRRGEIVSADPAATGRAILSATARFHNPAHAAEWQNPDMDAAFAGVWELLARGLQASQ